MKFRKILTTAAVLATTAGLLAGCTAVTQPKTEPTPEGTVNLTYWGWERNNDKVTDAFNASHPDIQVKYEQIPGGADAITKVVNAARAGNAPDIFTVDYAAVSELATQNILQDIGDLADKDLKASFPAGIQSLVQFGKGTWAVPMGSGALQLFYRADLFEKFGITVPTTWAEYTAISEKVKAADPTVRVGSTALDTPALLSALAWQAGAHWATIDGSQWKIGLEDKNTLKVVDYQQELISKGLVWTDPGNVLGQKAAAGQYLSLISGPWQAAALATSFPTQAGQWRVAPVPTWDGKPASAMYGGTGLGITKDSKKRAAAYEFIKWTTQSADGISARTSDGGSSFLPAATAMIDVAAKTYKTTFYGDQDIYSLAKESAEAIMPGWVWSPATGVTNAAITDAVNKWKTAKGDLSKSLVTVQDSAKANLTSRGIKVAN